MYVSYIVRVLRTWHSAEVACMHVVVCVLVVQSEWDEIYIPAVLVTAADGNRMMSQLRLTTCTVDEFGKQQYVPE